ncbi:PqqD family protein [Sphingobacterium sp. Mn56C]|uniref:PqqD family protein n=1 Tax=Sphingobacterium sp. Mn56C TaxID=3395261 RepID=UPI003BE5FB32
MRLRAELKLRQIGDNYVVVVPEKNMMDFSNVFSLNETAAWLWDKLVDIDFTEEDMVSLLLEEYDVSGIDLDAVKADVQHIVNIFQNNDLLVKT